MDIVETVGSVLVLIATMAAVVAAKETDIHLDTSEVNTVTMIAIMCISILIIVFVVSLCGGCTPMEVGSDDHAASGGHKSYTQYSSVATDVNTHVMSSGTTLPDDPYQPREEALPYPMHPQTPQTAQTFTGYQAVQQPSMAAVRQEGTAAQPRYQAAGANRHFSESEPPPPNYSEAMNTGGPQGSQPSAPAQSYGW